MSNSTCTDCLSTNVKSVEVLSTKKWSVQRRFHIMKCQDCGSTNTTKHCPECKSINLTEDERRGEICCKNCGLVLSGQPPYYVGCTPVSYPWGNYLTYQDWRYSSYK